MRTCTTCGKEFEKTLMDDAYLEDNCFDCSFWLEKAAYEDESKLRQVIIDGAHYMIGQEDSKGFRGLGGEKFFIKFHDGRTQCSTNLWQQGEIPERFRHLLPDNAVFVEEDITIDAMKTLGPTYWDNDIPF